MLRLDPGRSQQMRRKEEKYRGGGGRISFKKRRLRGGQGRTLAAHSGGERERYNVRDFPVEVAAKFLFLGSGRRGRGGGVMTKATSFILRSASPRPRPQSTLASLKGERRQNIFLKPEVHLFPDSNSPMLRWDRGSVFFPRI